MKKIIAIYSFILGIAVIVMWINILLTQDLPEGMLELGFHLYAEFAMAIICLVSAVMLWRNKRFAVETNMGGLGMAVYSVVNAAGYYAQRGGNQIMILFIIIFVLTVLAICGHYFSKPARDNSIDIP